MAIQLNERDELIFSLIQEHQVLLEKHISWFISSESKPVLIRDRLRKLFYLDYLLCQRHRDTLPWWTTPTKPLVYTLSPLTCDLIGANNTTFDLNDADVQRHLLEVANLRMLLLLAQKDGHLSNLNWTTCKNSTENPIHVDAKISFMKNGQIFRIGIINQPKQDSMLTDCINKTLVQKDIDMIWIVSRDQSHQESLQKLVLASGNTSAKCLFGTHQELYRAGMTKCKWEDSAQKQISLFVDNTINPSITGFGCPQISPA